LIQQGADVAQAFYSFLFGGLGVLIGWPVVEFIARPFRQFFDIRRQVNRCLVNYGNVSARSGMDQSGKMTPLTPTEDENERLLEAQNTIRGLAADMRAFANGEPLANPLVNMFGFDANRIASELIGLSNNLVTYGEARDASRRKVEQLLRIKSDE
jgi:hypothetical protein